MSRSISKIYSELNTDDVVYKSICHCYRKTSYVALGVLCFAGYKINLFRTTSTSQVIHMCHVVHSFHFQRLFVALMVVDIMLVLFTTLKCFFFHEFNKKIL